MVIPVAPGHPAREGAPALRATLSRHAGLLGIVALGAIVAMAAVLRFWELGEQGLWYDESVTAWLLRGSPAQMLAAIPHTESTPPLYYLVAWGWVRVLGDTATGLRSLSAVAGVATVAVACGAGRALAGWRVGLVAALLVAVNPLLVWYSQEARSYALLVLLCAGSLWLLAAARQRCSPGFALGWGAGAALALATHYFAVFLVLPEALLVLAQRGGARLRWRLAAVAIPAATGLALAGTALGQRTRTYWFLELPLRTRLEQVARQLLVGFQPPATGRAAVVAGAAAAAGLLLLALRGGRRERSAAAVAGAVGAGAVGLPALLAVGGVDYLDSRNVIAATVPLAIVVAAGLGARRAGLAGPLVAAALAAACLSAVLALNDDPLAQRPPWGRVAAALGAAPAPRGIVLDGSSTWARPLGFLLPHTWWAPARGARVRVIEVVRRLPARGDCHGQAWWGAACDVGARPAPPGPPARGFRRVSATRVAGFAIVRYRAPRPVRVYPLRPFERPPRPGRMHGRHRKLLVTPTRAPVVP